MQDLDKTYNTALYLERIVLDDAEKRARRIIAEAKTAEKNAQRDAKRRAREAASQYESEGRAAINARIRNEIAEYEAECRRRLIEARAKIRSEVEKRLCERLAAFSQTEEYGKLLEERLRELAPSLGKIVKAEYCGAVSEKAVKAALPEAELIPREYVLPGGCVVTDADRGVVLDLTLDSGVRDAMDDFPEISGLELTEQR